MLTFYVWNDTSIENGRITYLNGIFIIKFHFDELHFIVVILIYLRWQMKSMALILKMKINDVQANARLTRCNNVLLWYRLTLKAWLEPNWEPNSNHESNVSFIALFMANWWEFRVADKNQTFSVYYDVPHVHCNTRLLCKRATSFPWSTKFSLFSLLLGLKMQ